MADLSSLDPTQVELLKEECVLVDRNDRIIGSDSKKNCHLNEEIKAGKLHRAFSVFLFNPEGKLLIQQRAQTKITFPNCFTNSVCSHPLNTEEETEQYKGIGARRAARRKMEHELGIPEDQVFLAEFTYLTRIHYKAEYDQIWGEHEIDYVFFIQKDLPLKPNSNEVSSCKYVDQKELKQLLKDAEQGKLQITPWFKLICDKFLFEWWDNLRDLTKHIDVATIHRLT